MSAAVGSPQRATQVCRTCKARKKACDKRLPSCTYCSTRALACSYDDNSNLAKQHQGSSTVASILAVRSVFAGQGNDYNPPVVESRLMEFGGGDSSIVTLDKTLHAQVLYVLRAAGLTTNEVQQRYFREFHPCLPIIAPMLLGSVTSAGNLPPADVSLLLLAMCLVTQPPPTDAMYTATRMLWTSVSIAFRLSIPLTQAALLIATYEYSRGWLVAADVTLGVCARMSYNLGLNELKLEQGVIVETADQVKAMESWNLWWGIEMLEKIVFVEVDRFSDQQNQAYPELNTMPPFDLSNVRLGITKTIPVHNVADSKGVAAFISGAQAVALLVRVQRAVHSTTDISVLREVDKEIQTFVAWILVDDETMPRSHSSRAVSVAIAVRCLYILHQHLQHRARNDTLLSPSDAQMLTQTAGAALGTATKMIIDAAHDHANPEDMYAIHALPLCCRSNVRDAKAFLSSPAISDGLPDGFRQLAHIEDALFKRWG